MSPNAKQSQGTRTWTAEDVLALGRNYQGAAVLMAAAELELFDLLSAKPSAASELAGRLSCDVRGLCILLDALAALGLLQKRGEQYSLGPGVTELLTRGGPRTVLAMTQHQANCMRRWAQLAKVVKTGKPADRTPSVRGELGDEESFIGAMDNISSSGASEIIHAIQPLKFQHLLDIGGASGTWTMAFLRACPEARATLFDLPHVIPMAERRLVAGGMSPRVNLVPGDFMLDTLPSDADLAWVSAIVHQNSRAQNRALFAKVFQALRPGGRIAVRDIIMDPSRTQPASGALFAVNMLVATAGGGTFTFDELRSDLEAAGFVQASLPREDETMNSVLVAHKPQGESSWL